VNSPVIVFFYWVFGAFVIGAFASGREHGSSLIIFAAIMLVGLVGGVVHALVVRRAKRRTS